MGTRSTVQVWDEEKDTSVVLATLYIQFDGYPSGVGKDIFEALGHRELVNGYNDALKQTNGMGCAAALLIRNLKSDRAGGVYMVPPGSAEAEEFHYALYKKDDTIYMYGERCFDETVFFDGPIQDFKYELAQKFLEVTDNDEEEDEQCLLS